MEKYIPHHKKTKNTKPFEANIIKHQKLSRLLSNTSISNVSTRKLIEVKDLSNSYYSLNNNNKKTTTTTKQLKTSKLRSDMSDYSDSYIFFKGKTKIFVQNENNKSQKKNMFKNNFLVTSCILKIINIFIDNAEDVDML